MDITELRNKFRIIPNNVAGNCLFETISYLINVDSNDIRKYVFLFYRNFDKTPEYPENSLEFCIKMGILYDNEDMNFKHDEIVINQGVWGSFTDIFICSLIFKINIIIIRQIGNLFVMENNRYKYFDNTICILYTGNNHFEALIPISV